MLHSVTVPLPAPASQQCLGDSSNTLCARVSVLQHRGSGDTSVDKVDTEQLMEVLTQHVAGRLVVTGACAVAEVNVLIDSCSGITAVSEALVEALRQQPGMTQTALAHAFVGHARMVTFLGQECDIVTQSCPLHPTIETPWRPVQLTMPFIVLPEEDDAVIIGQ